MSNKNLDKKISISGLFNLFYTLLLSLLTYLFFRSLYKIINHPSCMWDLKFFWFSSVIMLLFFHLIYTLKDMLICEIENLEKLLKIKKNKRLEEKE